MFFFKNHNLIIHLYNYIKYLHSIMGTYNGSIVLLLSIYLTDISIVYYEKIKHFKLAINLNVVFTYIYYAIVTPIL